jgi:hypothetical protein
MRLINVFNVPPAADEAFMADWERVRESLAAQDGFGGIALFRALRSDVDHRYVDIARVDATRGPFASHPGLYEVVHDEGARRRRRRRPSTPSRSPPARRRFVAAWRVRAARWATPVPRHTTAPQPGAADFRYVDVARWSAH